MIYVFIIYIRIYIYIYGIYLHKWIYTGYLHCISYTKYKASTADSSFGMPKKQPSSQDVYITSMCLLSFFYWSNH